MEDTVYSRLEPTTGIGKSMCDISHISYGLEVFWVSTVGEMV